MFKSKTTLCFEQKAAVFLEAIGKKVVINEKMTTAGEVGAGIDNIIKLTGKASQEVVYENNVYKAIKESIQIAVDKAIIVPYEKSDRGKYILIHFPFFNGTMELKCCKKYKDVYWWCGIYRDLAIYACGNKKIESMMQIVLIILCGIRQEVIRH